MTGGAQGTPRQSDDPVGSEDFQSRTSSVVGGGELEDPESVSQPVMSPGHDNPRAPDNTVLPGQSSLHHVGKL